MAKAASLGVLLVVGLAAAACTSAGNGPLSAPRNAGSSSVASTTTPAIPTTTPTTGATPGLPPANSAEMALVQDLENAKSAAHNATSAVSSLSEQEATGALPPVSQISDVVAPVITDLAIASFQLTSTLPTLPASPLLTEDAQTLSTALTGDVQDLKEVPGELEFSVAASNSGSSGVSSATLADVATQAVGDYTKALGLVNETFSGPEPDFTEVLNSVVAL